MTPLERATEYVQRKGFARTPELAQSLGMNPIEVDRLLGGSGLFVTCGVQVGEAHLTEYRCSAAGPVKQPFRAYVNPKPLISSRPASDAPTPSAQPSAPVRVGVPQEEAMTEKKSVAERVVDALKKHGKLNLDDLAKHAGTTKATLYTMMGTLVKKHGVSRVHGERGCYEMTDSRQRVALVSGGELRRKKVPPINGSPKTDSLYAAALLDLQEKRDTLADQLAKLDRAIEAVGALAA